MVIKTCTDILKEAAEAENFQVTNLVEDELKSSYAECIKEMVVIPKGIVAYRAEMVPVFKNEASYFVEFDNVAKYMNAWDIKDVKEAVESIAEANEIPVSTLSVVIESKEYMESILETAIEHSKTGDNSLLETCELSMKLIQMMKNEGINIVTTH